MSVLAELMYSKDHEWVKFDGNKATIGVTDFAQDQLGDVVFVEVPAEGDAITEGDSMGTIESVKAVSDVYAPISGNIVEVNAELEDAPQLINEDAYGKGWIAVVEVEDVAAAKANLLDAKAYEELLAQEE